MQRHGRMPDGTTRMTAKGQALFHLSGCSTFSEYTVCAEISVAKVSGTSSISNLHSGRVWRRAVYESK